MKMHFLILYLIATAISCSDKEILDSEWSIFVSKNATLFIKDDQIHLVEEPLVIYRIDPNSGSLDVTSLDYAFSSYEGYGLTNNDKEWKDFIISDTLTLVEHFEPIDDGELSLHTYQLKINSRNNNVRHLTLLKNNRFYILDHKLINNSLYLILNQGDFYYLHKFNIDL